MKTAMSWLGASFSSHIEHSHSDSGNAAESDEASVLVVDDDARMRQSVCDLLQAYGYHCQLADGGEQALELLSQKTIDLLLLDLNMPGMDGYQVMQQVQDDYPDTDVIVVSGETTFENATEALRLGALDFVRKPYQPDDMIRTLSNVLHKRHLEKNIREMNRCLEASEQRYRFIDVKQFPGHHLYARRQWQVCLCQ